LFRYKRKTKTAVHPEQKKEEVLAGSEGVEERTMKLWGGGSEKDSKSVTSITKREQKVVLSNSTQRTYAAGPKKQRE